MDFVKLVNWILIMQAYWTINILFIGLIIFSVIQKQPVKVKGAITKKRKFPSVDEDIPSDEDEEEL